MIYDTRKLAQPKGLERHVAELTRLCSDTTIVGIVESTRTSVATRLGHARTEVQVFVARSTAS